MNLNDLSDAYLEEVLQLYDYKADTVFIESVRKYVALLERWNRRISLTTITSAEEIIRKHFGESLFALKLLDLSHGRLADVGSGAGFPALALKLSCPGLSVRLYEGNRKKCAFLHEVVRELGMENVEIIPHRTNEDGECGPFANYVTARAVGSHKQLLQWAHGSLLPHGCVILWLGQEDSEQIRKAEEWIWRSATPIPGSKTRVILVGEIAD